MAVRLFKRTTQSCRCKIGAQNLIVQTLKPIGEMSRRKSCARKYSYSTLELLQLDVDFRRSWPVSFRTVTVTSLVIVLFAGTFVLPIILTTRVVSTTLIALIVALLWRSRRVTTRLEVMERTRRQIIRSMAPVAGHLKFLKDRITRLVNVIGSILARDLVTRCGLGNETIVRQPRAPASADDLLDVTQKVVFHVRADSYGGAKKNVATGTVENSHVFH